MTDPRRQASPRDSGGAGPRGMAYPQARPMADGPPPPNRTDGAPPAGPAGPNGPHVGPVPVTATGVLIVIALVDSLVYFVFSLSVRDASQIPLLASGAVVLGLVFAAIAAVGA